VPPGDAAFGAKTCLEFVRSQAVPNLNCTMGKFSAHSMYRSGMLTCELVEYKWQNAIHFNYALA